MRVAGELLRLVRLNVEVERNVAEASGLLDVEVLMHAVLDPVHDHLGVAHDQVEAIVEVLDGLEDDAMPADVDQERRVSVVRLHDLVDGSCGPLHVGPQDLKLVVLLRGLARLRHDVLVHHKLGFVVAGDPTLCKRLAAAVLLQREHALGVERPPLDFLLQERLEEHGLGVELIEILDLVVRVQPSPYRRVQPGVVSGPRLEKGLAPPPLLPGAAAAAKDALPVAARRHRPVELPHQQPFVLAELLYPADVLVDFGLVLDPVTTAVDQLEGVLVPALVVADGGEGEGVEAAAESPGDEAEEQQHHR
mmetsp:Transcript_58016/g.136244  ORF Transcript_58016/g.136244 Transcript_58016/m.136244 type:complete len:306 (-) Transcript_58016:101-1018(-)